MGKHVYGYGRASTDKQTLTVDAQKEKVQTYCTARGLDLAEFIEDQATTSRKPLSHRDGGSRLCQLIAEGKVKAVVVAKLDRAFRSTIECLTTLDSWAKEEVEIHILDLGVDTSTPQGRFFLTVLSGFAEMERSLISERTSSSMKSAQRAGKRVSKEPPYGYEIDPHSPLNKRGKPSGLRRNEKEQTRLATILALAESGATHTQIAEELNSRGWMRRNLTPWIRQAVAQVLARQG